MELFPKLEKRAHDQVSFAYDRDSGYKGIIAIHDTTLGPALGGTRFWNYKSDEEALIDVLRLSRGMTYKAAVAGLNLGGGKSVVIGDPRTADREKVFRAHGRHVEWFGGRYITAEDVNTSPQDMEFVHAETEHVVGLADRSGDPSPVTAWGVFRGIQACAKHRYGNDDLDGKTVTIQGVGHVGYYMCKYLKEAGAKLIVTDVDDDKIKKVVDEFGAKYVKPEEIISQDADIFCPCALGGIIDDAALETIKVDIVNGGANNQLATEAHGDKLHEMGIIYGPDYVVNAGGLINVNAELEGWSSERAHAKASEIYDTVLRIFEIVEEKGVPTYKAADELAEERVRAKREAVAAG